MTGAELQLSFRALSLLLALLVLPAELPAQSAAPAELRYTVRSWQSDDGLPQNSVFALAQTPDGFLWAGTREGLARFDGIHFTPVAIPGVPEFQHASITALYVAQDKSLWVATESFGVFRLRPGEVARFTEADGLVSNQARCFCETADGSLWIGTEGGLSRWSEGKFSNLTQAEGLGDNSVRALCRDRDGLLRAATKRGLSTVALDGKVTSTIDFGVSWADNALRCVTMDAQGSLWAGTTDGLSSIQPGGLRYYGLENGLPDRVINALCLDNLGQLWVGTYAGLARVSNGKLLPPPNRESVFGELIYALCQDHEGNLWVGGRDGLYRLTPARFATYTTSDGLTDNNVMSVLQDSSGVVWVGLWGGGLNSIHAGNITAYPTLSNALPRDAVLSLAQRRSGGLWLGLETGGGLEQFDGLRRLAAPQPALLRTKALLCIQEARDGALWLGTSDGLVVLRGNDCQTYAATNGFLSGRVLALYEDAEGVMWLGTDSGLARWAQGQFTTFTTKDGLSDNSVCSLYEDNQHALWIGTRGGGLNRFRNGAFRGYTSREGLFSDEIYELLEDDSGFFWLTCRRGLFRIARAQFEQLDRGQISTLACTVFGKADGLLSVQFNGVAKPAGWKGRDGRLWFPTIRGVVAVDSRLGTNEKIPPVVLEQVLAERKPVAPERLPNEGTTLPPSAINGWPEPLGAAPICVTPGRGELEFRWTALSLQASEKNMFKYMLEGVDEAWKEVGPERTAYYNSLAPGSYRFRVLACNNDGVWNQAGVSVSVVLLPHIWQTWWFKAAVLLGLGLLLTLAYRLRVARLRELERLRVEIAANLHDDVGARLTKVAMLTERVEHQTPAGAPSKPHIQAISRTTGEVIQAMDEIVWTINPKNDTLEHLANYIFQYAQEYFQDTGMRCRLDMPAQLPERPISTDLRHNLFMVVKEALNNALKHSGASDVRITLAVQPPRLTITIADNGHGFEPAAARHSGDGLENMRRRIEQFGGTFNLEAAPGSGTRIKIEIDAA